MREHLLERVERWVDHCLVNLIPVRRILIHPADSRDALFYRSCANVDAAHPIKHFPIHVLGYKGPIQ